MFERDDLCELAIDFLKGLLLRHYCSVYISLRFPGFLTLERPPVIRHHPQRKPNPPLTDLPASECDAIRKAWKPFWEDIIFYKPEIIVVTFHAGNFSDLHMGGDLAVPSRYRPSTKRRPSIGEKGIGKNPAVLRGP